MTPGVTVVGVVFSNSRPLPLCNIRAPPLPIPLSFAILLETFLLLAEIFVIVSNDHVGGLRKRVGSREQRLSVVVDVIGRRLTYGNMLGFGPMIFSRSKQWTGN